MFLGVSDSTNWADLEDAEALAAATATTKDDHRQARGRDIRNVPMPHHAAVDTLKTFAVVCHNLWSEQSPLTTGMKQAALELERQTAYRLSSARFVHDVGHQLFSKLTRLTHAFLTQPPENAYAMADALGIEPTLAQIRDGQSFQAHFLLPWLTPTLPPPDRVGGRNGGLDLTNRGTLNNNRGGAPNRGQPNATMEANPTFYPPLRNSLRIFRRWLEGRLHPQ